MPNTGIMAIAFGHFNCRPINIYDHTQELVLNMNEHQIALVNLLGERYVELYSGIG